MTATGRAAHVGEPRAKPAARPGGAAVLGGYWLWHLAGALLQDTEGPLFIRIAVAAVALGVLILVISVVREKFVTSRRDPYQKEVIR